MNIIRPHFSRTGGSPHFIGFLTALALVCQVSPAAFHPEKKKDFPFSSLRTCPAETANAGLPKLKLVDSTDAEPADRARLLLGFARFVAATEAGNTPVEQLTALFEDREFIPDGGIYYIHRGTLNYYEYLLPLVNPTVQVYVTFEPDIADLNREYWKNAWYPTEILYHLRIANPGLFSKLGEPDVEGLKWLMQRVHFKTLPPRPADVVFAHNPPPAPRDPRLNLNSRAAAGFDPVFPTDTGAPKPDARAERMITPFVAPGGFIWVRIASHQWAELEELPGKALGDRVSSVANFGDARSTGDLLWTLESKGVAKVTGDLHTMGLLGPGKLDLIHGRTGATEFLWGKTFLFVKPLAPDAKSSH